MTYRVFSPSAYFPTGKTAAVVMSIDDIHPGSSKDPYEAGGDLEHGALGHLMWLQSRHPELKVTLFTTADWRQTAAMPILPWRKLPWLRNHLYLAPIHPVGKMSLERHPRFVEFLRGLPNIEIGYHGLHHVHRGPKVGTEFQDEPVPVHLGKLRRMRAIFEQAGLPASPGMTPPSWNATPTLVEAMAAAGLEYLSSSRDIFSPVSADAVCRMSGIADTPLVQACRVGDLVHLPTNFQATCPAERAYQVLESGGVLGIKAHIVKHAYGHVSLDAMDATYANYLDLLFGRLKERFGEALWWTSMGEINARIRGHAW